jgi:hypothetical protein
LATEKHKNEANRSIIDKWLNLSKSDRWAEGDRDPKRSPLAVLLILYDKCERTIVNADIYRRFQIFTQFVSVGPLLLNRHYTITVSSDSFRHQIEIASDIEKWGRWWSFVAIHRPPISFWERPGDGSIHWLCSVPSCWINSLTLFGAIMLQFGRNWNQMQPNEFWVWRSVAMINRFDFTNRWQLQ